MNYEGITHMWDMFQDFERLLIEILTGRLLTFSIMIKLSDNAYKRLNELRNKANKKFVRLDVKGGGMAVLIMSGLIQMKNNEQTA